MVAGSQISLVSEEVSCEIQVRARQNITEYSPPLSAPEKQPIEMGNDQHQGKAVSITSAAYVIESIS